MGERLLNVSLSLSFSPSLDDVEHGCAGGLRPPEDARHWVVRAGHAVAAQGEEDLLRDEDTGQAEGERPRTGLSSRHNERKKKELEGLLWAISPS